MLKKLLFLFLASVVSQQSYGQLQADIEKPKIVPPSPDAAALGKYGQIPVNKSTGVPSIEIPLYEIKTPRFTLPISLSYHASGIKVEEMASWVGLGWALNAGGIITRSIIGISDDYGSAGYITNTMKEASQIQWPADMNYIADAINGRIDTEPDNFFYNFNNHSGSFVFGDNKKPVLIPYQPILTHFDVASKNFDITDESGNVYYFNTQEMVRSDIKASMCGISTWYLTRMVSADLSDTLKFEYSTDVTEEMDYSYSFSQSTGPSVAYGLDLLLQFNANVSSRSYNPVRIQRILFNGGKVDFIAKGGRLDNGNILLDSVIVSNQDPVNKKYSRIKRFKLVTDYFYGTGGYYYGGSNLVSDIDRNRLKLNGVQEIGVDNVVIKSHQFGYNTTVLPHIHSFAQDRWGYYNGQDGNQSLLQAQSVLLNSSTTPVLIGMDGFANRGANRNASPASMQACVLNKIIYPTGGYTTFTYDCHQYPSTATELYHIAADGIGHYHENNVTDYTPTDFNLANNGNKFHVHVQAMDKLSSPYVPLLYPYLPYVQVIRVSDGSMLYNSQVNPNTSYDDSVTLPLVAGVHYQLIGVATTPAGYSSYNPQPFATITTSYPVTFKISVSVGGLRVSSINNFNADGSIANTETYVYGNNDESGYGVQLAFPAQYKFQKGYAIQAGNPTVPIARMVYTNNSIYPLSTFSGSAMVYPTVTLYHGDGTMNTGKSVYNYDIYPDIPTPITGSNFNVFKPISQLWKNGEPSSETHYSNTGNNLYTPVQMITNTFSFISRTGGVGTSITYSDEPIGFNYDNPALYNGLVTGNSQFWTPNSFNWFDYPISTGSRVLTSSIDTHFATGGTGPSVSTTTNYYYDNLKHMFPTRIITDNSKGESLTKTINYPQDMVAASKDPTGIYTTMATANIISPAIEQYHSKNGAQLLYEKTNYDFAYNTDVIRYKTTMIKPASVEIQTLSNPSEVRLQYLDYDTKGNVSTLVKDTGPKIGYRWGYNKKYPIAETVNAASNEFYYEGFEEKTGATLGKAHTGRYYYAGTSYTLNWSLPNARSFVVSYWYLNAGIWKYMPEQSFTGTISLSAGTGYDDIRIYPKDAQMRTYTYTPLLGITSETDASSLTRYYEYDNAGRLMDIRNQDNNIVKTLQYNYQQQPGPVAP